MKSVKKSPSRKISPTAITSQGISRKINPAAEEASGGKTPDGKFLVIPARRITSAERTRFARRGGLLVTPEDDLLDRIFRLEEENHHLRNLSIKDGLTGLYNKRFFNSQLKVEIARTRRTGEPFCLIFIDLDNFKAVNDMLGHAMGDEFLVKVSRRMKAKVRPTDFACRFGGDEFAVILPATTLRDAVKIAGRWHYNIERAAADMRLGVSASIGVDEFEAASPLDAQAFIERVDQRLYQAKREGKGRIAHPEIEKHEDRAVTWAEKEVLFHIFQPKSGEKPAPVEKKKKK